MNGLMTAAVLFYFIPGGQFHQHFTEHFLPIFWCQKISNPKHSIINFGAKILYEKCSHKMLMKLTPDAWLKSA